ncbi:MAG: hypothetical protein N3D11_16355 [Candidatus Sumerlaeia bacterium]|nr:hypothetical protein [Candidatus Sumerlaeia bacterium]
MIRGLPLPCAMTLCVGIALASFGAAASEAPSQQAVNLARFGTPLSGKDFLGVEWTNPRDVRRVALQFAEGAKIPPADSLHLQWWASVWPNNGTGGWMRLDDPWNGQWTTAPVRAVQDETARMVRFVFPPLDKEEWREALAPSQYPDGKAPTFRRTLKVRVVAGKDDLPAGTRLIVEGDSVWREDSFDIEIRFQQDGTIAGRIEVLNGELLSLTPLPPPRSVTLRGATWQAEGVAGASAGVRARIRYAHHMDPNSNDLTRVTVRLGQGPIANGFSFVPEDVLREGAVRLPDFGVLVSPTARGITFLNDPGTSGPRWMDTVRRRIHERPEASYASAMGGLPRLTPPPWIAIGVPAARQEVFISPRGDWAMWNASLHTTATDSLRIPYRREKLEALLDMRAVPAFDGKDRQSAVRSLDENCLPIVHVRWQNGPLWFHHTLAATVLTGEIGNEAKRRGDETVVLLTKLDITNLSDRSETATVNLRFSDPAPVMLREDGTIAIVLPFAGEETSPQLRAVRGQVGPAHDGWRVIPATTATVSATLRWQGVLHAGQTRSLYFKAPFVDLLTDAEYARLQAMEYEQEVPKVREYWRGRLARGMQIQVPEPALNHFYAAHLWHTLISTDRDPETGLYNANVGTVRYKVFANETVMIARAMDMRGEAREAERYLEPMLRYQGTEPLSGRFSTRDGVFHSAGAYTHGKYAMNHGFVLWGAADHYLFTRDRKYLERIADKLVRACDFLIAQRKATVGEAGQPRSPVHGLAPACSLEDVTEFQYWFATNGYFYLGMKRAAEALADLGHPDAARLAIEAEAFGQDIDLAVREAATRSAVVRRRDGCYVPYVPSRVFHWRHLTEGWIREALYCALHLTTAEVLLPDDPLVTWMLDELEDNIFFSRQSGFDVADVEKTWFERGGMTLQPCLLDLPAVYLARDEIPAALRAFYNTYALLIYPDVQCFAEWARDFGRGAGPVYKTSDESRFVMWLRQLLVWENGAELWLARGTPRAWLKDGNTIRIEQAATFFGPAGLVIRSQLKEGRITATVTVPTRSVPNVVWLRLRHPSGRWPARVWVNGRLWDPDRIVGENIRLLPGDVDPKQPIEVVAEY